MSGLGLGLIIGFGRVLDGTNFGLGPACSVMSLDLEVFALATVAADD